MKNLFKKYELKLTLKHNGKMRGIQSLSTSVLENKQCMKNAKIDGSICQKCFAIRQLNCFKKNFPDALKHNTQVLTSKIIPFEFLPQVNCMYFRFEAFGDLNNDIQFINYVNICNKNKHTTFALWTKNPQIIDDVFNNQGYKKPKNLIIIISSLFINRQYNFEVLPYSNRFWFVDKIFTVYDKKYILENNININCGSKSCINCLKCYTKNNEKYINEILK